MTDLPEDHKLIKDELFLPFLCIQKYDDFDDAIQLANNTEYGLTAGIFSEDKDQLEKFVVHQKELPFTSRGIAKLLGVTPRRARQILSENQERHSKKHSY